MLIHIMILKKHTFVEQKIVLMYLIILQKTKTIC